MKEHMHVIKPLLFMTVIMLFFGSILYNYISDNPVFGPPRALNGSVESDWDWYLNNREKRNLKAMNLSYKELISLASYYEKVGKRQSALRHYYLAKTIFPERTEPRVRMCYLFLLKCQRDSKYCSRAKKELYYAEKYMKTADYETQQYISKLIDLMKMDDLVQMDEKDALALIY